jgi:hypothetical protein
MKRYLKVIIIAGLAWGSGMFGFMTAEFINPYQVDIPAIQKLILCTLGGLVFGLLVALALYVFDMKRLNNGIDISKDELRPTKSVVLNLPIKTVMDKAIKSLSVLNNAKIISNQENKLSVKTGVNKRTFGEIVLIELTKTTENDTLIQVSSRPNSRYTLVDYGMNSDNVSNLISAISES